MFDFFSLPVSHRRPRRPKGKKYGKTYDFQYPGMDPDGYSGGRCDAPYGPSGPKRGCPWN